MLGNILTKTSRFISRTGLKLSKHKPEIALGVGIVGFVGTVVLAAKETTTLDKILEESNDKFAKLKDAKLRTIAGNAIGGVEYTDEMYTKDKILVGYQTGLKIAKNYAPAIALGAFSIAAVLYSHHVLSARNVALTAAYNIVQKEFLDYRNNVKTTYGEEVDRNMRYGVIETAAKDKNGNKVTAHVVNNQDAKRISELSDYSRIFEELNPYWEDSPELNRYWLANAERYFNDRLRSKGHVFLNEVYDYLGFKETAAGSIVGWIYDADDETHGDNYISFGLVDPKNEAKNAFFNGEESSILLDFNVDGVIYDKI